MLSLYTFLVTQSISSQCAVLRLAMCYIWSLYICYFRWMVRPQNNKARIHVVKPTNEKDVTWMQKETFQLMETDRRSDDTVFDSVLYMVQVRHISTRNFYYLPYVFQPHHMKKHTHQMELHTHAHAHTHARRHVHCTHSLTHIFTCLPKGCRCPLSKI